MIDLKNIHDMWKSDCQIDVSDLFEASRQTPALHAKYLELLSTCKLQLKRHEFKKEVAIL